jgi:hypothetical protein
MLSFGVHLYLLFMVKIFLSVLSYFISFWLNLYDLCMPLIRFTFFSKNVIQHCSVCVCMCLCVHMRMYIYILELFNFTFNDQTSKTGNQFC